MLLHVPKYRTINGLQYIWNQSGTHDYTILITQEYTRLILNYCLLSCDNMLYLLTAKLTTPSPRIFLMLSWGFSTLYSQILAQKFQNIGYCYLPKLFSSLHSDNGLHDIWRNGGYAGKPEEKQSMPSLKVKI